MHGNNNVRFSMKKKSKNQKSSNFQMCILLKTKCKIFGFYEPKSFLKDITIMYN